MCVCVCINNVLYQCIRYPYGQLVEINSHSLFSKWFSEVKRIFVNLFVYPSNVCIYMSTNSSIIEW